MTLSHDVTGDGPAVLLLHSTAGDRRMWDPQVPALAGAGYRVVRCDLPGFGDSPMPTGPSNDAEEVVALLDELGLDQLAIIGASGGGRVALEIAARWASRITGLALLCTALRDHERSPALKAFGEREDALLEAGDIDGAVELNVETWVGPRGDDAVRAKVREMQRRAFEVQVGAEEFEEVRGETDLAAITAPTLLISGAHDLPDFREIAVRLTQELAKARHVELAWAGHLPSLEDPVTVNPILINFLRGT
ncbi:MAG: alpha/beta hydrolase [Actinoplanes sp.]